MKLKLLFFLVQCLCSVTVFCDGPIAVESKNETSPSVERSSEITEKLKLAYENYIKQHGSAILQKVDETFKRLKITILNQLPNTTIEKVELFQELPFNPVTPALVENAFHLKPPSFIHQTIVGYGYDILKDTVVGNSPFIVDNEKLAPIGYSLPDIYNCSIKEKEELVESFEFIESYEDFKRKRLENLKIPLASVNSSVFTGAVRSTFNNVKPDPDAFITLTAIQQIRNFELNLVLSSTLDDRFLSDVYELTPFNENDRESEKDWKAFFGKYGTHVVTKAFGGGYMEGKASGDAIEKNLAHRNLLEDVKKTLISFQNLPENIHSGELQMSHTFFGGAPDAEMAKIASLSKEKREKLYDEWKKSVKLEPRIMDTDIELKPISDIVGSVDKAKGQEIKNSLDRFLLGNLYYTRKKYNKNQSHTPIETTTHTPTIPSHIRMTTGTPEATTVVPTTNKSRPCDVTHEKKCPVCKKTRRSESSDYTTNIIGQGFHVFQDLILPSSPFEIQFRMIITQGIKVPSGTTVNKIKDPCSYVLFKVFHNYTEYAKDRFKKINPTTNYYFDLDINQFQGSVKPGYNIQSHTNKNGPFSVYSEIRDFTVQADFSKFTLDKDFTDAANSLPPYNENLDDCKVHEQWLDFFGKYGTHVVKGGYGGTWINTRVFGKTKEQMNSLVESKKDQCIIIPWTERNKKTLKPEVVISSIYLEKINHVLYKFLPILHPLRLEYDTVMIAMFENTLKRCDEVNA